MNALLAGGENASFALNTGVAYAALATLLAWLLLFQVCLWTSRPGDIDPGPETLDLGPESPAVANLLVSGWRMTPDAATATLVDLAARRILGFEQQGPDAGRTVVRVVENNPQGLTPYERRIFNRVSGLARGGVVPAAALVRGDESWAKSWWRKFCKEAIGEARARGLSRDRWNAGTLSLLRVTALAPVTVFCVAFLTAPLTGDQDKDSDRWGFLVPAFAFGWGALAALVESRKLQRDTPAGRVAAARWLGYRDHIARDETFPDLPPAAVRIWDRHLAYAASFGIARTTIRALPLGARSDKVAWSAYGGAWHQVRIRYPSGTWGYTPLRACTHGVFQLAIGIAGLYYLLKYQSAIPSKLDELRTGARDFAWAYDIPITIAGLIVLRGTVNLIRGLAEYASKRETRAEVVRLVRRQSGDSDSPTYYYFAAFDDGRRPRIRALRVTTGQYSMLTEGDEVRVVWGPYLGHIFALDVLTHASRPEGLDWDPDDSDSSPVGTALSAAMAPVQALSDLAAFRNSSGVAIPAPTDLITSAEVSAAFGGVPVEVQESTPAAGVPLLNTRMATFRARQEGFPRIMVQVTAGGMARRVAGTAARRGQPLPQLPGAYARVGSKPAVVVLRGDLSVGVMSLDKGANPALITHLATLAASRLAAPAGSA